MYFIGVTTAQSSINAVFPRWAQRLGLGDCELRGLDFSLHDAPANYRAAVDFIKRDPLSLGALITSHKLDVWQACRDQFDAIEPLANTLGEISSIYKREGRLHGRSVDPWTVGYALEAFLPCDRWSNGAAALILGAGGAGTALAWHLGGAGVSPGPEKNAGGAPALRQHPSRIHIADRQPQRLEHLRRLHASWRQAVPLDFHPVRAPQQADELLPALPPGSLVVNATGAGKDTPGSPLTDAAVFPQNGIVWEFNYRGSLVFLEQARAQQSKRTLQIEDGWVYFLHGWTRVMADVFNRDIPTRGPLFDELGRIAAESR